MSAMADTFPGQHPDEQVDLVFRKHPVVMRKYITYSSLILALGLVPSIFKPLEPWAWWFALGGLVLALIAFGYRFLSWYFSVYIITDSRLIEIRQTGFFNRSVEDISHNRIQSVNYEIKGLQATLLKYGHIYVQTYAGPIVTMKHIHRPEEIQEHLNERIRGIEPNHDPSGLSKGGENEA